MPHHLVALARVTATHVALDSGSQTCPLKVLPHEGLRPRHAVVPGQRGVMVLTEDVEDEGCCCRRDENAPLIVEDATPKLEMLTC